MIRTYLRFLIALTEPEIAWLITAWNKKCSLSPQKVEIVYKKGALKSS